MLLILRFCWQSSPTKPPRLSKFSCCKYNFRGGINILPFAFHCSDTQRPDQQFGVAPPPGQQAPSGYSAYPIVSVIDTWKKKKWYVRADSEWLGLRSISSILSVSTSALYGYGSSTTTTATATTNVYGNASAVSNHASTFAYCTSKEMTERTKKKT